jgi:hypothetical protein
MTVTDHRLAATRAADVARHGHARVIRARRLWLPWRPRLRLILAYPRCWHHVVVSLGRVDAWVTLRFTGRARPLALVIFFAPYVIVRFLGLVVVFEITIVAFTASVYLVWAEWAALLLLFPFVLVARLARALPWPLTARAADMRWSARVAGWRPSREAADDAMHALAAASRPAEALWSEHRRPARIWM